MQPQVRVLEHQGPGRAAGLVFAAGDLAADVDPTGAAPETDRGARVRRHAELILANLASALGTAGTGLERTLTSQVFLRDADDLAELDIVWREFFPNRPPRTVVEVGPRGLLAPGALMQIDVIAAESGPDLDPVRIGGRELALPSDEPECVVSKGWVFTGGKLATDPTTGQLASGVRGDPMLPFHGSAIERQAEHLLERLHGALDRSGSDFSHVVKAQIFLRDLKDFNGFHQAWARRFTTPAPSTTVQMARFPVQEALCQIDLVAVRRDIATPCLAWSSSGPKPLKHAQGSVAGGIAFPAGHVATDFATGVALAAKVNPHFPFYGSDIELQTDYVLDYLHGVLEASNSSLEKTVRAQIFMRDLNDFHGFDRVWRSRMAPSISRTVVEVAGAGLLTPGTLVEIDLIALAEA